MAVNKQFLIFELGVFLNVAGCVGVLVLTSSINIEDGLGTTSLAVAFGTSVIGAFLIPILIEHFGCRLVIVTSEICYLLFVITNVYSSYNLIFGGVFYGWGEAGVWTAYPIVASRFAAEHSVTGSKTTETYINHYIGYFFTGVQASIVFGNAAGFLILYIDRSLSNRLNITHVVNYSYCGANDCQSKNVTMLNIDQYTPVYVATRYIVVGVFSLLIIIAVILHLLFLPNDKPTSETVDLSSQPQNSFHDSDDNHIEEHKFITADNLNTSHELVQGDDLLPVSVLNDKNDNDCIGSSIVLSLKLFIEMKHLLILLLPIYNGLVIGFILGEVTRAFGACIHGLDKVSIGGALFGVGDALFSFVAGKVAGKYGRNLPFGVAFAIDIISYIACLSWQITEENSWCVYVLFFFFGVSDGIWQTLINVMYGEYFVERKEIAFNLWNVLVNIGTTLQFAISTSLCVYQKIYIQIAVLIAAMITYSISQFLYYPAKKSIVHKETCSSQQ